MKDDDIALIKLVLSAAGKAGEQGFAYLVHWQFIDGLTSAVGFACALAGSIWLLRRAFRWSIDDDMDLMYLMRGAVLIVLCGCAFGFLCGLQNGIRDMIAPEGAAIHSVLHN